jgi:hypothetical protein
MIGVGLLLLAIGLADLVAGGLAGEPRKGPRSRLAVAAGVLTVGLGAWITGLGLPATLGLVALLLPTLVAWLGLRADAPSAPRAWAALACLAAALGLAVALSPL